MKHKTGDDRVVLKKKLQDLEREWEKVCQMSVARQDKLENAYKKIGQFRYVNLSVNLSSSSPELRDVKLEFWSP